MDNTRKITTTYQRMVVLVALSFSIFILIPVGLIAKDNKEWRTSDGQVFFISPEERSLLEDQALAGNGSAAFRLSTYYNWYERDRKEGLYWLHIGAENGDKKAQSSLASVMETINFRINVMNVPKADIKMNRRLDKRSKYWRDKAEEKP